MTPDRYNVIAPHPAYSPASFGEESSSLTDSLKVLFAMTPGRVRRRDRRATPRVQVELCCEELSGRASFYRTTFDLSTFGISTTWGRAYPAGTVLSLRLHVPDDLAHPLELRAEVVGQHEGSGGMRLAFRNPPAESVRRIHKYLFGKTGRTVAEA